ncbi:MAG: hypothetical protein GXY83_39845 [Rhodopirellula sp.]|mgnify:FL=1|nr:hypothetical protein [Rhodopirellula sp.]
MPLTLNVGISKKVGLPDFGSVGATCNVSVELDAALLSREPDAFQQHVRRAYAACSQAVNDELARQTAPGASGPPGNASPTAAAAANGNGTAGNGQTKPANNAVSHAQQTNSNGNGNSNGSHGASQKQIGYINQLARQIRGLGVRKLDSLTGKMFGKPLAGLSSLDASALIDQLKAIKDGSVSLDAALNGAPS